MSVLVEFQEMRLWYLGDSLRDLDHPLAPLGHCDKMGKLLPDAIFYDSFAHVTADGDILRYLSKIGTVEDLKPLPPPPPTDPR
jgi:hypothetical protein